MKTIGQTSKAYNTVRVSSDPQPIDGREYYSTLNPKRREGLLTETPLTRRGKAAVALVGAGVLTGSILLLPNPSAPNHEQASKAQVAANKARLTGTGDRLITQLSSDVQTLPAATTAYADADMASGVRFVTGQGKLKNRTLKLTLAGIVEGGNGYIWEAFDAPDSLVEATAPVSTTEGKAERMVFVPVPIDSLPTDSIAVDYIEGVHGDGTFEASASGHELNGLQSAIVPVPNN